MSGHFRNAGWSGAITAFRAASGLANSLLAVRLVGIEHYGLLATLLSVFALYLSLGASVYTVMVAQLMAVDKQELGGRGNILASAALLTGLALLVLVGLAVGVFWLSPVLLHLEPAQLGLQGVQGAIMFMALLTGVQMLSAWQSALIEASGRLDVAMKAQLFGPLVLLIGLAYLYFAHGALSGMGYLLLLCLSASVDLLVLFILRRFRLGLYCGYNAGSVSPIIAVRNILRAGGVLQAATLMNLFLEPLNKMLLAHFVGSVAVTTYDLAMKVIWGIQGLFGAAMRVFLHMANEGGAALGRAYLRVVTLVTIPILAVHVVGAAFLAWVAHSWVKIDPQQIMLFYAIATVSNLGMLLVTPLYISLIGREDLRFIFRAQATLSVTNILVSGLLIPMFGLVGAAFGLLIACIYNVIAVYRRHVYLSEAQMTVSDILSSMRPASLFMYLALLLIMIVAGGREVLNQVVLMLVLSATIAGMAYQPLVKEILMRARKNAVTK